MKAILVGSVGEDRIYYVIDAGPTENDGAIVRPNGSVSMVKFFPFVGKVGNVRKIRTTRFHRSLWDAPKNPTSGSWYETFIEKTKPLSPKALDGAVVVTRLGGSDPSKIKKKSGMLAEIANKSIGHILNSNQCCGQVVKSDRERFVFKTLNQRKQAWNAMILLHQLEVDDE